MSDPAQSTGNANLNIPSFFGDINSQQDFLIQATSEDDDREFSYNHSIPPSECDFEELQHSISKLNKEDTDQQFWGDNEQESTSLSDNESSTHLCRKCKKEECQYGKFCNNCVQIQYKRKKNWIQRMKMLKKRHNAINLSPSADESTSTSKPTAFTHRKPPMYSGPSRSHVYASGNNHIRRRSRKRKLSFIASSSSSTGSDSTATATPIKKTSYTTAGANSIEDQDDRDDKTTTVPLELCPLCNLRPKNAIIIHGPIGHQCYCYRCTMKQWRANGKCPMCQQKIRKVIKNIK